MFRKYLVLFLVAFVAGCVNTTPAPSGLALSMDANPEEVFSGGTVTISVDVENKDVKTLSDVNINIFETGLFDFVDKPKCSKKYDMMDPKDFKSFACNLRAKEVDSDMGSKIWASASYKSSLSAYQTFEMISRSENEMRKKTGRAVSAQKSFTFSDSNLEVTMELSDSPVVVNTGDEFVSFSIKNIGNGFIEKLNAKDIKIEGKNVNVNCDSQDIYIKGAEFPRFSCGISPGNKTIDSFITSEISIRLDYAYEIRDSITARIVKGSVQPITAPAAAPISTPTPVSTTSIVTNTPAIPPVWVEYTGDVLPTKVEGEAKWTASVSGTGLPIQQIENGVLHLEIDSSPLTLIYGVYNSEAAYAKTRSTNSEFTLETRLKIAEGCLEFRIRPRLGLHEYNAHISTNEVGLVDFGKACSTFDDIGKKQFDTADFHTYRITLTKEGAKLYVDNSLFSSKTHEDSYYLGEEFVNIELDPGNYYIDYLKHTDDGAFLP